MESIRAFLSSGAGKELLDYLLKKRFELLYITNLKELDTPTHQVLELKAAKRAYLKLTEIYDELAILSEEEKKKDPRDSFDIS